MPYPLLESSRKRRKTPKLFDFHSFIDPGLPVCPSGPFRESIRLFLQQFADPEPIFLDGVRVYSTFLVVELKNFVVPLYTIEEDAQLSNCPHCCLTGWGSHLTSKRNYHFVIPLTKHWGNPIDRVPDGYGHLLHGVIHLNGYGHLIEINGVEGGARFICGRDIMSLWDRICSNLHARKISVEDVSRKHSMELRLLYGAAYGYSWFGRWGYRFHGGANGVSEEDYRRSLDILNSTELSDILSDFRDKKQYYTLNKIIQHYTDLSDAPLSTLPDLLRFMLSFKSFSSKLDSPTIYRDKKPLSKDKLAKTRKLTSLISSMDSRWPPRRLEFAAEVIVEALKEKKLTTYGGMTRQDVRDAARMHIGDTGLLDYVLKSLNNVIVGSYVVRRCVNPRTKLLEYTIEDYMRVEEREKESNRTEFVPGDHLYSDMVYVYENVVKRSPSAGAILEGNVAVKEWPLRDEKDHLMRYLCVANGRGPGEVVVVGVNAGAAEVRRAAEDALRDTYREFEGVRVSDMEVDGAEIRVRAEEGWRVRCECGARDDDGERMVECDVCATWQHTRCNGIEDCENVPPLYICDACCDSVGSSVTDAIMECDCDALGEFLMIPDDGIGNGDFW